MCSGQLFATLRCFSLMFDMMSILMRQNPNIHNLSPYMAEAFKPFFFWSEQKEQKKLGKYCLGFILSLAFNIWKYHYLEEEKEGRG